MVYNLRAKEETPTKTKCFIIGPRFNAAMCLFAVLVGLYLFLNGRVTYRSVPSLKAGYIKMARTSNEMNKDCQQIRKAFEYSHRPTEYSLVNDFAREWPPEQTYFLFEPFHERCPERLSVPTNHPGPCQWR